MKEHEEVQAVSQFFKILSDPTRLKILMFLKVGERNVSSISDTLKMEQSAVSHQLKLLRDNRLVKARRDGADLSPRYASIKKSFSKFFGKALFFYRNFVILIANY